MMVLLVFVVSSITSLKVETATGFVSVTISSIVSPIVTVLAVVFSFDDSTSLNDTPQLLKAETNVGASADGSSLVSVYTSETDSLRTVMKVTFSLLEPVYSTATPLSFVILLWPTSSMVRPSSGSCASGVTTIFPLIVASVRINFALPSKATVPPSLSTSVRFSGVMSLPVVPAMVIP